MTLPPRRALTSRPVASQSAGQSEHDARASGCREWVWPRRNHSLAHRADSPALCVGLLTPHSSPTAGLQGVGETCGQQAEPFGRRTGHSFRLVEAVHQVAADFVLLQEHGDRLSRVDEGRALAAALGVGRQCLLQLIGQSEVIDDQSALLVADDAAHSGDGNAGKPSSFRNALCFPVAVLIASSISTNSP